eukprot:scpid70227/ scgid15174/ 
MCIAGVPSFCFRLYASCELIAPICGPTGPRIDFKPVVLHCPLPSPRYSARIRENEVGRRMRTQCQQLRFAHGQHCNAGAVNLPTASSSSNVRCWVCMPDLCMLAANHTSIHSILLLSCQCGRLIA